MCACSLLLASTPSLSLPLLSLCPSLSLPLLKVLYMSTVRVVIPKDKDVVQRIHRMIEFVIREGPMLEAMIMHKEMSNPQFRWAGVPCGP